MKRALYPAALIVAVLFAWELVVRWASIPEYLLPPPSKVAVRLAELLPSLLPDIAWTATEALLGFGIAAAAGFSLALAFVGSSTLERAVYPYAIALKSIPIVAIAPLLTVWFGNGLLPKLIVVALISFFPILVTCLKGFVSIDHESLDLFDSLAATRVQRFLKLQLPSSMPYLFAGLRVASTLAVIGAIVAEFAGADRGLGYFIVISSHRLNTVDSFVGIVCASLLGIAAFYAVAWFERWALRNRPRVDLGTI